MFEKYSYKKKCAALLVVFLMLSITAYKRSFLVLFQVISENKALSIKSEDIHKKSKGTEDLIKAIAYLDKTIGKEGISKDRVQQGIVNFATEKHPQVSINDLQPIHVFSDSNYTIITNQLDVTANVNQLLQLSYDFEKKFNLSRIVNIKLYTTKKNNTSDVLHLKMIFQNYENN